MKLKDIIGIQTFDNLDTEQSFNTLNELHFSLPFNWTLIVTTKHVIAFSS